MSALTADQRARLSVTITADIVEAIRGHQVDDVPTMLDALYLVDPGQARLVYDTIQLGFALRGQP